MTTTPSVLGAANPNAAPPANGTTPASTDAGAGAAPQAKTDAELKQEVEAAKAKAAADATKTSGKEPSTKDDKPADGTPAASESPEFSAKLPEGMVADEALLGGYTAKVKELGLKSDQAQALLDVYVQHAQEQAKAWEREQQSLIEKGKKDPEIGGDKYTENLALARRALSRYGSEDFQKAVLESPLGNDPEVIRFLVRVGRAIANDSVAGTTPNPNQTETGDRALLKSLYPNTPSLFR